MISISYNARGNSVGNAQIFTFFFIFLAVALEYYKYMIKIVKRFVGTYHRNNSNATNTKNRIKRLKCITIKRIINRFLVV